MLDSIASQFVRNTLDRRRGTFELVVGTSDETRRSRARERAVHAHAVPCNDDKQAHKDYYYMYYDNKYTQRILGEGILAPWENVGVGLGAIGVTRTDYDHAECGGV